MTSTDSTTTTSADAFKSGQAFKAAFEAYLNTPAWNHGQHGYRAVKVLQVYWNARNSLTKTSKTSQQGLRDVFASVFKFHVIRWPIPDKDSHAQLKTRVEQFIQEDEDDPSVLKIFYYNGHGAQYDGHYFTFESGSTDPDLAQDPIYWGGPKGIQIMLENSKADTLIILDACESANTNTSPEFNKSTLHNQGVGNTWLIAACGHNDVSYAGSTSLTTFLIRSLRLLANLPQGFTVAQLNRKLLSHVEELPDGERQYSRAPVTVLLASSRKNEQITLMPVRTTRPFDFEKESIATVLMDATNAGAAMSDRTIWGMAWDAKGRPRPVLCTIDPSLAIHAISRTQQHQLQLFYQNLDPVLFARKFRLPQMLDIVDGKLNTGIGRLKWLGYAFVKVQLGTDTTRSTNLLMAVLEDEEDNPFDLLIGEWPGVGKILQALKSKASP